jgi:site-specific DNA recombinase
VQEKLSANAVDRQVRLKGSAALLAGRLFDDRGNRMSPTHANKKGVRYRYYVSQALLQNRKAEVGSVSRAPAPEIESLVWDGVRRQLTAMGRPELANSLTDRELIERLVARVIVTPQALKVCLNPASEASRHVDDPTLDNPAAGNPPITITLPWTAPSFAAVKGILHEPSEKRTMKPESRDTLLAAIAKARKWIDDIRLGHFASFAEIAEREAVGERHIRLLAPLAFLSPRIIAAIVEGTAPADLTVTGLAKALPYSWAEQERRFGLLCNGCAREPAQDLRRCGCSEGGCL